MGTYIDIVKYFIEDKKCNPHIIITANKGASLLHAAASCGHTHLVRYFIEEVKLDHMVKDSQTNIPMHYAAQGNIETLDYFITKLKCDINTPKRSGFLLIHDVAAIGRLDALQYLLRQPNCDVMGYSKGAPLSTLHVSAASGHTNIVQCLTAVEGVDPFCPDCTGHTPIHYAAALNRLEVVKFYVSTFGSKSLQIRNNLGQTPLDVAMSKNSHITALYLTVQTFMLQKY